MTGARRASSWDLGVALVVLGGALVYGGTRGHARHKEHPPGGTAVGQLHVVGGPKRQNGAMPDTPLPGTVRRTIQAIPRNRSRRRSVRTDCSESNSQQVTTNWSRRRPTSASNHLIRKP